MNILYFGIFNPDFSRNKVYADGLKANGINIIYCNDTVGGILKWWRLYKKHKALKDKYDAMIVGYPGYIIVPFARLIAKKGKPIIFDALCSFYEAQIISRNAYRCNPFRIPYVRLVDWLSTRTADKVLIETDKQRDYFINELGVSGDKCITVYTGTDESAFYYNPAIKKNNKFTVLFRGRIMKEAGVIHVLKAAKILENDNIDFLIIGFGWGEAIREFNEALKELNPKNVKYIKEQLPIDELRDLMLGCHISLGQFEANERLKRTVPHKAYESLNMRLPYITARTEGIMEILTDGETCLMVNPRDPEDLVDKIKKLRDDNDLTNKLIINAEKLYKDKFSEKVIVQPIIKLIKK